MAEEDKTAIPIRNTFMVQPVAPSPGSQARAKIITTRGASFLIAETRDEAIKAPCYFKRNDAIGD